MEKITIHDVAAHSGVSVTTVSRVLNNRGYISDATRTKVNNSINELGFIPNEMARAFYTTSTKLIGLIVPTISNPFFGELSFYIEKHLSHNGYKLLICNSINEKRNEKEYLRMLQENRVDGIIIGSHSINIDEYEKMPLKSVAVERYINPTVPLIQCDNYRGGLMATDALYQAGCRYILCLRGDPQLNTPANERYQAYEARMKEYNLPPRIECVSFTLSNAEKYNLISEILKKHPQCDGIFAGDDIMASITYQSALSQHFIIPEQLKIIGFDGTSTVQTVFPQLATIKQPIQQLAETSVNILLQTIDGKTCPAKTVIPVSLYHGQTLG